MKIKLNSCLDFIRNTLKKRVYIFELVHFSSSLGIHNRLLIETQLGNYLVVVVVANWNFCDINSAIIDSGIPCFSKMKQLGSQS